MRRLLYSHQRSFPHPSTCILQTICGSHGGDPSSVEFCHQVGMNYVSCSPIRVLTARLAAAQVAAGEKLSAEGAKTK